MNNSMLWLGPLLTHIQANLHGEMDLGRLAHRAELSSSHFHRTFSALVGETPRAYVERLRVERAAFQLMIRDQSMLQVALDCGFQNQETFIRAFRRRFGLTPGEYRKVGGHRMAERRGPGRNTNDESPGHFELSETRIGSLREMHLACIRHVGPYEDVPSSMYDELLTWAQRRRVPAPLVWMGIGHDAPGVTEPANLRFDAAVVTPAQFPSTGRVMHQRFSAGEFAITTHTGPFSTLPQAYAQIFPRVMRLSGYRCVMLPAIEIYHSAQVDVWGTHNQTDICLPVVRTVS